MRRHHTPLPRIPAAIHFEHMASHETTGITGEEDDGPSEFVRLSPPPHGGALTDEAIALGVVKHWSGQRGLTVGWRDGIDLHPCLGPFQRQDVGQLFDRAL